MYREGSLFLHAGDDGGGGLGELDHDAGDVADNLGKVPWVPWRVGVSPRDWQP